MTTPSRLKTVVDSLDALPTALHSLYREGDGDFEGRYVLDVDEVDGFGLAHSGKLTSGLAAERKVAREATAKLKELQRQAESLAREKAALEEQIATGAMPDAAKVREQLQAQIGKTWESKLKSQQEEHSSERQRLQAQRDAYQKQLESALYESAVAAAATGGKFRFSPKILGPQLRGRVKIDSDDNGALTLRVLDATGEPKFVNGRPASIEDLVAEFTRDPDFGPLIARADQQPPSGGAPRPGMPRQSGGQRQIVLTHEDMSNFSRYESLKAQAAKEGLELVIPPRE